MKKLLTVLAASLVLVGCGQEATVVEPIVVEEPVVEHLDMINYCIHKEMLVEFKDDVEAGIITIVDPDGYFEPTQEQCDAATSK